MKNGPVLITAATADPVTVGEAKSFCQITGSDSDVLLTNFITGATAYVQQRICQQLMPATFLEVWDWFEADTLTVDRTPLSSVSFVKYYDAGTELLTTIDSGNYYVDTYSRRPRIVPISTYTWPSVMDRPNAVQVQYVAGYANAATVPQMLKQAIMTLVYHWFDLGRRPMIATGAVPMSVPHSLDGLLDLNDRSGYS